MQREVSALLDPLYEAAIDAKAWTYFLDALAQSYGGIARVVVREPCTGRLIGRDRVAAAGNSALARLALQHLTVAPKWESQPGASDEFFRSDARHLFHCLESTLFADESFIALLALKRERRAFTAEEICNWHWLGPHLRRVAELRIRAMQSEIGADCALLALDALGTGVALVAHDGMLLFASRVAEHLFARGDGLGIVHGRVRVASLLRESFAQLLQRIATDPVTDTAGEVVALPREHGERPISALVMPLARGEFTLASPAAVILFHDPLRDVQVREKDLASLYGLTTAEGRLLRELIGGVPLAQYAVAAGIARNTAKTYLHQIFTKTGRSRQADLVREVLSDPLLRIAADAIKPSSPDPAAGSGPRADCAVGYSTI